MENIHLPYIYNNNTTYANDLADHLVELRIMGVNLKAILANQL